MSSCDDLREPGLMNPLSLSLALPFTLLEHSAVLSAPKCGSQTRERSDKRLRVYESKWSMMSRRRRGADVDAAGAPGVLGPDEEEGEAPGIFVLAIIERLVIVRTL